MGVVFRVAVFFVFEKGATDAVITRGGLRQQIREVGRHGRSRSSLAVVRSVKACLTKGVGGRSRVLEGWLACWRWLGRAAQALDFDTPETCSRSRIDQKTGESHAVIFSMHSLVASNLMDALIWTDDAFAFVRDELKDQAQEVYHQRVEM